MLHNFQIFGNIPFIFLLLINSLIQLCFENFVWLQFFLNFIMWTLWPNMWSVMVNVQCELEKNMYFAIVGWSILLISLRSSSLIVVLWSNMCLLMFCLPDLSVTALMLLKSPTIIMDLSIFFFSYTSIRFFFTCFHAVLLGADILRIVMFQQIDILLLCIFFLYLW